MRRDERTGRPIFSLLDMANAGTSSPIAVDPNVSFTTAASRAAVPVPAGSPIGKATLLNLNGSDQESAVVSVTLVNNTPAVPAQLDATPTFAAARASALVEWGVGGVQDSAIVDFLNGTTFTLEGSFIRVTGFLEPIGQFFGGGIQQGAINMILGAFAGYGATGKSNTFNAKKTIYIDQFDHLLPFFAIPKHATNLMIVSPVDVDFSVTDIGHKLLNSNTWPAHTLSAVPLELSGDAAFIAVNAGGGANPPDTTAIRLVFGISF